MLLGGERLPVSVEINVILGYHMLNLSRAICLGFTCWKVKPVVGGCFRYVTVLLLLYLLQSLHRRWNLSVVNCKWHFQTKVMRASHADLAPGVVRQFLSWSHHKKRSCVSKLMIFYLTVSVLRHVGYKISYFWEDQVQPLKKLEKLSISNHV